MRGVETEIVHLAASRWGDTAARLLRPDWLGRVWDVDVERITLVSEPFTGEIVRLVTAANYVAPFDVVIETREAEAGLPPLPRGAFAWRVGPELWIGDSLTVELPTTPAHDSSVNWSELRLDETTLHRRLVWLSDFVLARAPEGAFAGFLPELLVTHELGHRPDLVPQERLLRWRAGHALSALLPSLEAGDLATAEQAVNRLAGLGPGIPTAGDQFLLGFIAGLRLWPQFLEPSGLNQETVLVRLARTASERTGLVGAALLREGIEHRYGAPWHELARTLQHENNCSDERRQALEAVAQHWLTHSETLGSSGLAGLLVPFLWHQRRAGWT
jgi:hypothetical protein